jgi:type I restriction enzyme R subunit
MPNQNPEQISRDQIDKHLEESGWIVQDRIAIDFSVGLGIAIREYQTDIGPADYVLFVAAKAVGVIEASHNPSKPVKSHNPPFLPLPLKNPYLTR